MSPHIVITTQRIVYREVGIDKVKLYGNWQVGKKSD